MKSFIYLLELYVFILYLCIVFIKILRILYILKSKSNTNNRQL